MVSVLKRMRRFRRLLDVRLGPGAAILPPEITKIHMDFAIKDEEGHKGARQFWKTHLCRLKYHNPSIPMTISKSLKPSGPSLLTLHITSPESAATTPPPINTTASTNISSNPPAKSTSAPPTERTEEIDMKDLHESEILSQVMRLANARQVEPTVEDQRMMREMEEHKQRAARDRVMVQEALVKLKKEQDALKAAIAMES